MIAFIEVLRAIAAALVANSHFKGVYPRDFLSFGGGMGLALFYMISGYLLANIKETTPFRIWYGKKLLRLYIPLFVFRITRILIGNLPIPTFKEALYSFIFPATWFGASLVVLYPICFLFVKYIYLKHGEKSLNYAIGGGIACYILLFIFKPRWSTFSLEHLRIENDFSIETPYLITQFIWLTSMLIGIYIRKDNSSSINYKSWKKVSYLFLSAICASLFMMIRLMTRNGKYSAIQLFLIVAYVGFAYYLFKALMCWEEQFKKFLKTNAGKCVELISKSSLEIYYVQFVWISTLKHYVFPANWILIVFATVGSAYILHTVSNGVYSFMISKWRQ